MPKPKQAAKKKRTRPSTRKPAVRKKNEGVVLAKAKSSKEPYTEEYTAYLERYELYGSGRPRLSAIEFDRLDDEMLDLLALEAERRLNDDQIVRMQELEYLLLDSEQ